MPGGYEAMKFFEWSRVPEEHVNPLATRQIIHSDTMTVIRRRLLKGSLSHPHTHPEEQISMIEQGSLRFVVADQTQIVTGGQAFVIASNALHSVEALEDSLVLDVFAVAKKRRDCG
jgi:quercetin dioxygenase-like cupin family protein